MIITADTKTLGSYSVGNQQFLFKMDALRAANNNANNIVFHFNDALYQSFDCTREPTLTLKELYRLRAQQLRDKYDYIVVTLSGGPDSTNVLNSFVDNGIQVDEIVNMNSYDATGTYQGTIDNADYVYNAKPTLDKLIAEHNLTSRITILDAVDIIQQHGRHNYSQDSHELLWNIGGPSCIIVRAQWARYVPHIWQKIINGDKIAIVNGAEKPNLKLVNGKYAFYFHDLGMEIRDPEIRNLNVLEPFYCTPDLPQLVIKQAHVLLDFVNSHPGPEYYTKQDPKVNTRLAHNCPGRHGQGNLRYDLYHSVIYPKWSPNFVTPKTADGITRSVDCWWMKRFADIDRMIWQHTVRDFWKNYKQVAMSSNLTGIPVRSSRPFFIE
jgi:hypothetical protein